MKTILTLLVITFVAFTQFSFAQQTILVNENFDQPTGLTYHFPPQEGETFGKFCPPFTAWANQGGQVEITYADSFGLDNTAGIQVKVIKEAPNGYYAFQCDNLKIPVASAEEVENALRKLEIEFAIKIPAGKKIDVYLGASSKMLPAGLVDELKGDGYLNRLSIIDITGDNTYTKHRVKLSDLPADKFVKIVQFMSGYLAASGGNEIIFNLFWNMSGRTWVEGEIIQIDAVKISFGQ